MAQVIKYFRFSHWDVMRMPRSVFQDYVDCMVFMWEQENRSAGKAQAARDKIEIDKWRKASRGR